MNKTYVRYRIEPNDRLYARELLWTMLPKTPTHHEIMAKLQELGLLNVRPICYSDARFKILHKRFGVIQVITTYVRGRTANVHRFMLYREE